MRKRFLALFGLVALVAAFAGTVPAPGSSFKVNFTKASVVKGKELKAGEYRVSLGTDKVTITDDKTTVDAAAKIESATEKFKMTAVRYLEVDGKAVIAEIRVGGTTTRITFEQ